jgi:REP element-mobilizing transposase RayT
MGRQLSLDLKRRGGKKGRSGRKQVNAIKSEPHRLRAKLDGARLPVHVTVRVVPAIGTMRRHRGYRAIRRALRCTAKRPDFRVVHLSLQRTHVHFLVEADDALSLARGMQGLQISAARWLNRELDRRGNVFADRYHPVQLDNPRQVRNALRYVLVNWRHHGHAHDMRRLDPYSTAYVLTNETPPLGPFPVCRAQTWLLSTGWARYGPIRVAG